jgi:hypothetical protein
LDIWDPGVSLLNNITGRWDHSEDGFASVGVLGE